MKKLLKEYSLNSDMQYFEMIAESYLNGQVEQAKNQFLAMPKQYRKSFIKSGILYWGSGLTKQQIMNVFFELL
jgi:hypothetical protein